MRISDWSSDVCSSDLLSRVPETVAVDHFPDALILPGFIDAHIHFPQTQVIASYGAQLMDWLERYALVEEQRFAEPKHSVRSEEHTSELQSLMRISYAVFCLKTTKTHTTYI